ncbi:MAG: class I SAM-dependent methyltransferase [Lachnospiraceae bacterium]|nr:class I SAM-dependent methyltransferase [Lachnospiraceae bacterium]
MFWDKVSGFYDFFETIYNGKVYRGLGEKVAGEIEQNDIVLECACGTGAISKYIAPKCKQLIATDFSEGMLRQTSKHCRRYNNIKIKRADMTQLKCRDNRFDKVVAGNVIHLLEEPHAAIKELERVCKTGGKIIVPTYINASDGVNKKAVRLLEFAGANFKRQFDINSYRTFFEDAGYENVQYYIVEGRMPCAVAIITKQ